LEVLLTWLWNRFPEDPVLGMKEDEEREDEEEEDKEIEGEAKKEDD
jgi:hypothetical protein